MMDDKLTLDEAVADYNELRSYDHGIVGAYVKLCELHGSTKLPALQEILDRRAKLSGYR